MSIYSAFYASLSGLSANGQALSVIGNDLSNLNTIGYKSSTSQFQDLFSAASGTSGTSGNGNPMQIGLGTQIAGITQNFAQGSFSSTNNVTDMAISGSGLFMLRTNDGSQVYSRAGNFTLDSNGFLINPNGAKVLGWNAVNGSISTNGIVAPIQINTGTINPPVATSTITTTSNLNSGATNGTAYTVPVQIYDSLGNSHTLSITYTKRAIAGGDPAGAASAWNVSAVTEDGATTITGLPASVVFDSAGGLISPATGTNPAIQIQGWTDGAGTLTTNWNIWNGTTPTLTGYANASGSSTSNTTQNGFAAGNISSLVVDGSGIITGNFTNGQTQPLAQVAVATFANLNGLSKVGNNAWLQTLASGVPNVGPANSGGRGSILGSQLELSNADVADEFTKLIIAQRGYQANSRIVTTTDQLLQETLNLKQ